MTIVKRQESDSIPNDLPAAAPVQNGVVPTCKFVNLELCGMTTNEGRRGSRGTLLLENPSGCYPVKYKELVKQVRFFGFNCQWKSEWPLYLIYVGDK